MSLSCLNLCFLFLEVKKSNVLNLRSSLKRLIEHDLHFFIRTRAHFCSKFNKLRTIQPRLKNKASNFQLKVFNKTAASAAQFAKCILLHTYSRTIAAPSCASTNKNFI